MFSNHSHLAIPAVYSRLNTNRTYLQALFLLFTFVFVLLLTSPAVLAFDTCKPSSSSTVFALQENTGQFDARFSNYKVCIPKDRFGLNVYHGSELLIADAASSVSFKGKVIDIGKPLEFYRNEEQAWLEMRGWYSKQDNLWYVARYQFHPGVPVISLSFSVTDRHDNHPSGGSWQKEFWQGRVIQDLRFDIETTVTHERQNIEQLKVGSLFGKRQPDAVLQSQQFALNIKDFWKKFPISAETSGKVISWRAIREPTVLYGGAGITIDFALSLDIENYSANELTALVDKAPLPGFPDWWLELDGSPTTDQQYLSLLVDAKKLIARADAQAGNWGWKNYGDYQISAPYYNEKNQWVINWAALQYDLTLGLMLGWVNTGDEWLWDRSRAAVRNIMDVQVSKFHPYPQKQSGAGIRKGACTVEEAHWCQPSIPEFNYHSRALLLYSHLTGEIWPKEIARMQIDNSAYFAYTRTDWSSRHYRIGGWALRNLYYGHALFGDEGTKYISKGESGWPTMYVGTSYKMIANKLVEHTVNIIEQNDGLGGSQPVWGGQLVEGLIIALENDMLEPELRERTHKAIETAVNKIVNDQLVKRGNNWWMVYYVDPNSDKSNAAPELSNLNNYGWFWVNSLAWVSKNTGSDHSKLTRELISWLMREYRRNPEVQTPRSWSSLMGFPSYAINSIVDENS